MFKHHDLTIPFAIIFAALSVLAILLGILMYFLQQTLGEPGKVYATQTACEQQTGQPCEVQLCDVNCPKDFKKGWAPVSGSLQDIKESKKDIEQRNIIEAATLLENTAEYANQEVIVRGVVREFGNRCTLIACPIDNPCCNDCVADLGFSLEKEKLLGGLPFRGPYKGQEVACRGNECNLTCHPFEPGTEYTVRVKIVPREYFEGFYLELLEIIAPSDITNDSLIPTVDELLQRILYKDESVTVTGMFRRICKHPGSGCLFGLVGRDRTLVLTLDDSAEIPQENTTITVSGIIMSEYCGYIKEDDNFIPCSFKVVPSLQDCRLDSDCPDNEVCYNSQPCWPTAVGFECGEQAGDLKCHATCSNDADCPDSFSYCNSVTKYIGDAGIQVKICEDKRRQGQLDFSRVKWDYCVLDQDCQAYYGFPHVRQYALPHDKTSVEGEYYECSSACLNKEFAQSERVSVMKGWCDPRVDYELIRCRCEQNTCVSF